MSSLIEFLTENLMSILIVSLSFLAILIVFAIFGNDFSDIANTDDTVKKPGKVVTIETYNNMVSAN